MNKKSSQFLVKILLTSLKNSQDIEKAMGMSKYMKNQFTFFGIPSPTRIELVRTWHSDHQITSLNRDVVLLLWEAPQREGQYAAMDHIKRFKKQLNATDIPWLESLILHKSWWDTVDFLAVHVAGEILSRHPEVNATVPDRWISTPNLWMKRTALLYQLKYKNATNFNRLQRYILLHLNSKEFFINKAAGWALREYAKTDPAAVLQFVEANPDLSGLTKREALKNIIRYNF